ncbi:prolipoprotein diacylglyceryl transferase [Candidatus Stoquefichus massiliensis]|uniref:prolipoprotein diacylglyceryl transferase n=1 Tax=Candidatus Stoquefichus massiliensis TaxID=1470350 RepID=UPI00048032F3|nr:prolipoprotein diacylglyceryl transferase [Candidatus Stoquefichus massiliensis]
MRFFENFSTFVSIGPFHIQWYAIVILSGACFAYFLGQYRFKQLGYNKEILSDYFFALLFIGIVGARIWYVIFTFNDIYINNPIEIFAVWHGGLAIQGGIFTGLIYSYFFFKKRNIPFLVAGDAIMPGVLIAQACGRWGNFFNHEAFGGEVSLNFLQSLHLPQFIVDNMYIGGAYHHPTFLYESVGNIIAFLLIIFVIRKFQKHIGIQFFSYFVLYGIVRFFVEGMRTDSLMFGPIRMAQLISIVFLIAGIAGIIYVHFKGKKVEEFQVE